MSGWGKYVWGALAIAVLTHFAFVYAVPRVMMNVALERLSSVNGYNAWTFSDRVTPASRAIVRPSPDFAYSACAYDLSDGPITITATPWNAYWSLSLYAANSDNYFVIDDREARGGADVVLVRRRQDTEGSGSTIVTSPTTRGVALIRRLAPDVDSYNAAAQIARNDVCAPFSPAS